jgi:putative endonuclease
MEQKLGNKLNNKETGRYGEQITANYLKRQGFEILGMNYLKKWGEIDVIAKKDNKIHFVEVKTVSYETKQHLNLAVTRRTYRPEENVHAYKIKKLARAIESWISEFKWEGDWQIDVAAVRIVPRETYASINYIDNVIMD